MSKPFVFKQFSIQHQHSAMKVGTDGVLLGAWATPSTLCQTKPSLSILDIGTGTGLIALMCAQRFANAHIDAIEIDALAVTEAQANVAQSKFASRIHIALADLASYTTSTKYNLIVCNPPFFTPNSRTPTNSRQAARQTTALSFAVLLQQVKNLLAEDAIAAFILPFDRTEEFVAIANSVKLYLQQAVYIQGSAQAPFKRSLVQLSHSPVGTPNISQLVLELSRHVFSPEHKALVQDFYRHL